MTPKPTPPRFRRNPRLDSSEPFKNSLTREEMDRLYDAWRAEWLDDATRPSSRESR